MMVDTPIEDGPGAFLRLDYFQSLQIAMSAKRQALFSSKRFLWRCRLQIFDCRISRPLALLRQAITPSGRNSRASGAPAAAAAAPPTAEIAKMMQPA